MNPVVSIIVPVYRVPLELFRRCLDSLVRQKENALEILVISDGASEEICSCVREYCVRDKRIRLFDKSHEGVSSARNYGVEHATGEYVSFVDADDWLGDDIVEKACRKASEWKSDVLIWDVVSAEGPQEMRHSVAAENIEDIPPDLRDEILRFLVLMKERHLLPVAGPWSKLYRRDVLLKHKFRKEFTLCQDRVLNFEIYSDASLRLSYLHDLGYFHCSRPDSSTGIFRPDLLDIYIRYVAELDRLSHRRYPERVGAEMWKVMWRAWMRSVRNPQNTLPFFKKYGYFTKRISDKSVRRLFDKVEGEASMPLKSRLELFAMRHGIMIFFWFHAISIEIDKMRHGRWR